MDAVVDAQTMFQQQIGHYVRVLQNVHDKMVLYVDEQADRIIEELKQRYTSGAQLPDPEQFQQMLPLLLQQKTQ